MDDDSLEVAYARYRLATALMDLDRAKEAQPLATKSWQRMGNEEVVPITVKVKLLDVLARACETSGQSQEAAAWRERAAALDTAGRVELE